MTKTTCYLNLVAAANKTQVFLRRFAILSLFIVFKKNGRIDLEIDDIPIPKTRPKLQRNTKNLTKQPLISEV